MCKEVIINSYCLFFHIYYFISTKRHTLWVFMPWQHMGGCSFPSPIRFQAWRQASFPSSNIAGPSSYCFLSSYYNLNVKCPPQTHVFANLVPTWGPVLGGCRILRGRGSLWRWYLLPASTSCFPILWDVRSRHLLLLWLQCHEGLKLSQIQASLP